ncbi:hypothetical protein LUZ60_013783 [Juncus effusus]|nr:hypothetical protein LUZ60_013783 [Juncus effusus]
MESNRKLNTQFPTLTMESNNTTKEVRINLQTLLENQRLLNMQVNPGEKEQFTIFRIPSGVRKENKSYYEPQMVSIGPYYHGNESLRAMEENKVRHLQDFLDRFRPHVKLEDLLTEIRALETRARQCYSESICHLDGDQFVQMLVLDGCFILEQCHKWSNGKLDTLSSVSWVERVIVCDLLLMENQIPFFVLETLHRTCSASGDHQSLLKTVVCILEKRPLMNIKPSDPPVLPTSKIHHLLHFYHEYYVPNGSTFGRKSAQSLRSKICQLFLSLIFWFFPKPAKGNITDIIPCASDLSKSGVVFRKKKSPKNLFDITFSNGILKIPTFEISIASKKTIANLLAYDGTDPSNTSRPLWIYLTLLYHLIDTTEDAKLLERWGIMVNMDPRYEETVAFLNHLESLNFWHPDEHFFADLFSDVQEYYNKTWNRYRAKLKRDYFGNPWSIISLVAGLILMVLTFLQTYYTIYPKN